MFQLARGRHYIGGRIPDNAVAVMPNHFTFHTLQDVPEMFYPADVVEYAIAKGWYAPKDGTYSDFDFAGAYQAEDTWRNPGNVLRQKHGQRIVLGRDWNPETEGLPFVVYPENPVSLDTLRRAMMTHYEGTEDACEFFGPGHSPHYCPDHRRICTGTTLICQLWEFQEKPQDTCVYSALGRPCQVPMIPLHPLRGLPKELLTPSAPEAQMAEHLLPHPGVTAHSDTVYSRFRRLVCGEELLFSEVSDAVKAELDSLYEAAKAENEQVQGDPAQAVSLDKAFMYRALETMEAFAETHFFRVQVQDAPAIEFGKPEAVLQVRFSCPETPKEESLVFGVEYTDMRSAFAEAVAGSLQKTGESYTVQFPVAPMLKVLPAAGNHTFWLGGNGKSGRAFAGCVVLPVRE